MILKFSTTQNSPQTIFSDVAMGAFFPRDQVGEFKGENGGQAHDLKIRPQYQRYRLHGTSECDAGPGAWPQWSL